MHHQPPCEKVLVGKTTMYVKWGIKLMEENSHQQGQGFMRRVSRELRVKSGQGMTKEKKKVSMQSLCRSLCLLDSAGCLSG